MCDAPRGTGVSPLRHVAGTLLSPLTELAAYTVVASMVFNLDEAITHE